MEKLQEHQLTLENESAMLAFGKVLAKASEPGLIIYLHGQLGAGKTTLTRGFLHYFGVSGPIKSPTFTLVEPYILPTQMIYHFDLYRLNSADELNDIGLRDYVNENSICLFEWPDKGKNVLPKPDLSCYIDFLEQGRTIKLQATSMRGNEIINRIGLTINSLDEANNFSKR